MPGNILNVSCNSPYLELQEIISFLTSTVGWSTVETITDTGSILDVTLSSSGESDVINNFTRYIRFRNTATNVFLYTYETYVSSASFTGEVYDPTYGAVTVPTNSQGYTAVVVADLERVIIVHSDYNEVNTYTGYVGRISAYHSSTEHSYPNIVKGSTSRSYTWYYSAAERNTFMLGPTGVQQHYYAIEPMGITGLDTGETSDRDGQTILSAPVLVNNDADSEKSELVGEPRGVFRLSTRMSASGSYISIDGDTYIVVVQNGVNTALGPIGTVLPVVIDA